MPTQGNDICAIIVTFSPDKRLLDTINALQPQVAEIVIIDNGTSDGSRAYLEAAERLDSARVIYNGANLGVGAALNTGVEYALDIGYKWVATFDQDSLAPPSFMESMLKAYFSCSFRQSVALVAPVILYETLEVTQNERKASGKPSALFELVTKPITSGSLIKSRSFSKVGFFDEDLFIDSIDSEFDLRLLKNGFQIIKSCQSTLIHRWGSLSFHPFLGRTVAVTHHDPLRRYFMTRNRIIVNKKYFTAFPMLIGRDFVEFFKETVKIILYEQQKAPKFAAIAHGIVDGLAGRLDNEIITK